MLIGAQAQVLLLCEHEVARGICFDQREFAVLETAEREPRKRTAQVQFIVSNAVAMRCQLLKEIPAAHNVLRVNASILLSLVSHTSCLSHCFACQKMQPIFRVRSDKLKFARNNQVQL